MIKQAIEAAPGARYGTPRGKKIVINPLLSPEFGSSSASRPQGGGLSPENASEKSGGEGGITRGGRRSSSASLRTAAAGPRRPKIAPRFLSNPVGSSTHPAP